MFCNYLQIEEKFMYFQSLPMIMYNIAYYIDDEGYFNLWCFGMTWFLEQKCKMKFPTPCWSF